MITKMTGMLTRVLDEEARVQVGSFEYQVLIPEAVRRVVQARVGHEVTFHITEYLEGNSGGNRFIPRRVGFLTESELDFFDLFCTVEKIGAKKALKAMARPVKDIADAIARQDAKWLTMLPGIGATTAEQIITTLKRKVMSFAAAAVMAEPETKPSKRQPADGKHDETASEGVDGRVIDEVYQALMGLGHNPLEARNKLDALLSSGKSFANVQEAIGIIYSHK